MCRRTPNFVKVGRKYRALYMKTSVRFTVGSCYVFAAESFNATIGSFVLLLMTGSCSVHTEEFFRFNCNDSNANALQCYVICKLSVLFGLLFFLRKWPCCTSEEHPYAVHLNLLASNDNMAEEENCVYSKPFVLESLKDICNRCSQEITNGNIL